MNLSVYNQVWDMLSIQYVVAAAAVIILTIIITKISNIGHHAW